MNVQNPNNEWKAAGLYICDILNGSNGCGRSAGLVARAIRPRPVGNGFVAFDRFRLVSPAWRKTFPAAMGQNKSVAGWAATLGFELGCPAVIFVTRSLPD